MEISHLVHALVAQISCAGEISRCVCACSRLGPVIIQAGGGAKPSGSRHHFFVCVQALGGWDVSGSAFGGWGVKG